MLKLLLILLVGLVFESTGIILLKKGIERTKNAGQTDIECLYPNQFVMM